MQLINVKFYVVLNYKEQNLGVYRKSFFFNNGKIEFFCLNFIIVYMIVWEFGFNLEIYKMLQVI